MAKRNLGTTRRDAPLVIALGPGFEAGQDCHAVIETNRGHSLGRVILAGSAEPDTGRPGSVKGHESDRVLRAPAAGFVTSQAAIGDVLHQGDPVAWMGDQPVYTPLDGVLRGLIHPSVPVNPGMKIGDVDPRAVREHCFTISDKALAIGGGVLEAVLSVPQVKELFRKHRSVEAGSCICERRCVFSVVIWSRLSGLAEKRRLCFVWQKNCAPKAGACLPRRLRGLLRTRCGVRRRVFGLLLPLNLRRSRRGWTITALFFSTVGMRLGVIKSLACTRIIFPAWRIL